MDSIIFPLQPLSSASGGAVSSTPPLVAAVRAGNLTAVNALIAADGVDLEARDSLGYTALLAVFDATVYTGVSLNRYPIFKALLAAGADPNAATRFGETPLMLCLWRIYAAFSYEAGIAHDPRYTKRLLRAGADPNATQHGESVFYMALKHGKYQEAAYILQAGANPLVGETGGIDAIGDGIFVREELVDLILQNTRDGAARIEYVTEGRKVLRSLLLILDGRPHVSVFAINTWPRRNFIADYSAERLHDLYKRFTLEDRMPLLKIWHSTPRRWKLLRMEQAIAAREAAAAMAQEEA